MMAAFIRKNTMHVALTLQGLIYEVCSIVLTDFSPFIWNFDSSSRHMRHFTPYR